MERQENNMANVKKSKESKESNQENPQFLTHYILGVNLETSLHSHIIKEDVILSVYKSEEDATFMREYISNNREKCSLLLKSHKKVEFYIRPVNASVSFGKTLPSDKKAISELTSQLDTLLESLSDGKQD